MWVPKSFPATVRANWEFMAVVNGRAKPIFDDKIDSSFLSRRLWVMPPMSKHTWSTPRSEKCEVVTMHFASLPPVVEYSYFRQRKPLCIPITPADIATIKGIYNAVLPHYKRPHIGSAVWFEKALIDLCILVVQKLDPKASSPRPADSSDKLHQALDWYRANAFRSPTISDLCKAVDVSETNIRKMFKAALNDTPIHALQWLALNDACMLMATTTLSLKEIASRCGFVNSAQFHRAFKRHFQMTPSEWSSNRFYGKLGFKPHQI